MAGLLLDNYWATRLVHFLKDEADPLDVGRLVLLGVRNLKGTESKGLNEEVLVNQLSFGLLDGFFALYEPLGSIRL